MYYKSKIETHPIVIFFINLFNFINRDSDNPVLLDSELCSEILKTLEDAPDSDDKRGKYSTLRYIIELTFDTSYKLETIALIGRTV